MPSIPQTTTTSPVDLPPGTRVRHALKGITGTVDPDAVDRRTRRDYPAMVPVQWDGDDAWLTAPHVLEPEETGPAASADVATPDRAPVARRPRPGIVRIGRTVEPFGGRLGVVDASNRRAVVAGMVRVFFPGRLARPAAWGAPTVAYYDPRALEYVQRPTPCTATTTGARP
ncbi:hypothetical protein [Cellulosimicrobium cellulans]|uniref:hypothetical protein n=1 Tax=Cellulosimicrobium cellulans TaxID=1710 RepID=UPI002404BAE8|nr:hypothetical protein [Cellulosimicrobium cellulans]MDF9874809.1 hypothetical protein [Cellulosimicrobium cellulans]